MFYRVCLRVCVIEVSNCVFPNLFVCVSKRVSNYACVILCVYFCVYNFVRLSVSFYLCACVSNFLSKYMFMHVPNCLFLIVRV